MLGIYTQAFMLIQGTFYPLNQLPSSKSYLFIYFYHSKRQTEQISVYDFNVVELPPVWDLWVTAEAVSVTSTGRAD